MGIAASLFHSTTDKNTLDWRIRPSDEQYDQQMERWNDLAEFLLEKLKERSGYSISSWLQGSYKFGTQVRPHSAFEEFDIDLGVYFRWEDNPGDGVYGPLELKGFVRDSLIEYAADEENEANDVSDPKTRCERLHFKPDFHIDVPCYHLRPSKDVRHLATEQDEWETSDPKAIYKWWVDTFGDAEPDRLRRMVRYLKMWAALRFEVGKRPSSILLTVLAGNAWSVIDRAALRGDDEYFDAVVREVRQALSGSLTVENPVDEDEDLNRLDEDASQELLDKLEDLEGTAARALAAPTKSASAEIWGEAFEHFFPMPDEEEEEALAKAEGRDLIPILFDPQVFVEARPRNKPEHVYRSMNKIGPIPKNCDLTFTLTNAEALPVGAEVRWTVRNQGQEAEDNNDLGHQSDHALQVEERSAYRGTQYMDVAVRLRGSIIGRRRIPVKITGMILPLRNPPKPSWVKLRGRR